MIERVEYVCYKFKDSLQNTANSSINVERNILMTRIYFTAVNLSHID